MELVLWMEVLICYEYHILHQMKHIFRLKTETVGLVDFLQLKKLSVKLEVMTLSTDSMKSDLWRLRMTTVEKLKST